ncbi:MAG: nuclear transport factor 2 family protein [Myxococcales bacterium]|nr:nuclear transport factor 2 family protein [Myxococcales bacterium]
MSQPESSPRDFDPERSWRVLEARLEQESDPRRRQLLEWVRDHVRSEILGDLESLMATLIDEPQYHFFGMGPDAGPKGRAAVEAFYKQMLASGGNRFEFEMHRVVVDEGAVVTEGQLRQVVPGSALVASQIETVESEAVDPAANYLSEMQILTLWPAGADGRLVGEDIYFGSPPLSQLHRL